MLEVEVEIISHINMQTANKKAARIKSGFFYAFESVA
jgi:hypothetical protein